MSKLEPPPSNIKEFIYVWKNWLNNLWLFLKEHTGGTTTPISPTSPTTGSNWNAHGNIAVSDPNDTLTIQGGSFLIDGAQGSVPADINGAGTYFLWSCSARGLRIGSVSDNKWYTELTLPSVAADSVAIGNDASANSTGGVALGTGSSAGGNNSVAVGQSCATTANNAISLGYSNSAAGSASTVVGIGGVATSSAIGGTAIGYNVKSDGLLSTAIGSGVLGGAALSNNVANSTMLGAASATPTLTLVGNRCGVNNQNSPLSTLDVNGSVGYQYRNLEFTADNEFYAVENNNELTFTVNFTGAGNSNTFIFHLPEITASSVDRRMYHIFNEVANGTGNYVDIKPYTGQYIYQYGSRHGLDRPTGVYQNGTVRLGPGDAIQLVAAFSGYDTGAGRVPTWRVL